MSLTFIPLGVGDAFSRKHYSSCLAVWADGKPILVDCPHPIRKILAESTRGPKAVDLGDVEGVVLTHLHADHASGLEGYMFFSRFRLGSKGRIASHDRVLERLWPHHLAAGMDTLDIEGKKREMTLHDYVDTVSLSETQAVSFGDFSIECRRTDHHVPTYALRISAGGKTLSYSADTGFDASLVEWLSEADLMIHETNEGIHTPYEQLARLPARLRSMMRLIHYPDNFDLDRSRIEPLVQGRLYEIP